MTRRKRFSVLAKLPGAPSLLWRAELPIGSRSVVGAVATTLLERALGEPGAVRLEIVIFVGPAAERWDPESLQATATAGSESRVWELSRQLAELGHRVRVFADCAGMEGVFWGVEWLDYSRFGDLDCDVLVTCVEPAAVDPAHDVRARLSMLWLLEADCGDRLTPAFERRFDAYLCANAADAARFHARYPYVPPRKILQVDAAPSARAAVAREFERHFAALLRAKRLDIVIFTGPALELWNPDTLQASGMGGSETMAWELSRHLVALGHRVRVFGHCAGMEGLFEGVEWLDYARFSGLSCDVLLSSRQPAAVDRLHAVQAKLRLLWVHDVHCGDKLTSERDARIDAYLCLSAWHVACFRQHHPQLHARKVLQLRNGIDMDDFPADASEARDPRRVIYSSCPSRGLQIALDVWPKVRAAVPGATLHVYYGFENWERRAVLDDDRTAGLAIAAMKLQIASSEGVVFHGRIDPKRLAEQFRAASVWAYPDWFHETSCITAMQAQAAGLRIVSSALAALNETVAERGVLLTEDPHSEAYRTAFTEATIAALRCQPTEQERAALRAYAARHFDLPRLAGDFVALFRAMLERRAALQRSPTLEASSG